MLKSLNQLRSIRKAILNARSIWIYLRYGIKVKPGTEISLSSRLRPMRRGSISVGPETLVAFKTLIFTKDYLTGADRPVSIGARCFIGGGSTILPGVTVHDEAIVGAGSVVFDDVPARTIVAGNPARVLKTDIEVGPRGRLKGADENTRRLWKP